MHEELAKTKTIEWRFATQGLFVCASRLMDIGLKPEPAVDILFGVEVARAQFPQNASMVAAALSAILDGEPGPLPAGSAIRLARFTVWDGYWVAATNARGQSTIITKRPSSVEAKGLADRLNAALDAAA